MKTVMELSNADIVDAVTAWASGQLGRCIEPDAIAVTTRETTVGHQMNEAKTHVVKITITEQSA